MFSLTKSDAQLLEVAEGQFQNTMQEASFLRQVRHAAILESHGIPGDTAGRFIRSGEHSFEFISLEEEELQNAPREATPPEQPVIDLEDDGA